MRAWIKKNLPDHTLKDHPRLQWLGRALHHPNLWHLNKQGIARGVATGIFVACLPLPLQMVIAAMFAVFLHANLPIAVMITWINNPFTFIPINFFFYKVGAWILAEKEVHAAMNFTLDFQDWTSFWQAFSLWMTTLGKPYFVGLAVASLALATLGYLLVIFCWREQDSSI